jgi:hypothetical protein
VSNTISLTPGFSPVVAGQTGQNRFNGFSCADKPLKRLARQDALTTRLKPGVNENRCIVTHLRNSQLSTNNH